MKKESVTRRRLLEMCCLKEAQKQIEALVHIEKLKDIHTKYERCKFNQFVATTMEK